MIGGWKKFHNMELHHLYSSPNIIKIIKSRRMRETDYVAPIEEKFIQSSGRET
jgi:hypothetical protein